MGFSESGHGCKKHPHHQEKQGVCPSCLRERLSRLCSAPSKELVNPRIAPSLSFSHADYRSASSSKSASPARHRNLHKRNGSGVMGIMGSSSFMVKVGTTNGFKKSRSIAFVPRNFDGEEAKNGKKKKGFWSKLLRFKAKKDFLTHSTSMRLMIGRVN
ncbi:uncharacterized protein LOC111316989 [Durio zibethinus]|uniref:Uncharacterized protein LOC111316989 n=1 Tax=Durio zibethinus TaxID=66656 RepID=A0A6P6BD48_DURZI|nr:uncharacterized protein LOC111316989 [Durio zibethinus]